MANPTLLDRLRSAQSLTISDGWWAYGPVQTVAMTFTLSPTADGFSGTGDYQAQSYYGPKTATTRPIAIPTETMSAFLDTLAASPLGSEAYIPDDKTSDYSPKLRIAFETPEDEIIFHSESQGKRHVPWEARIGEQRYSINTSQPMDALDLLEPYLKRDETVKQLTATIDATRAAQPTATAAVPALCTANASSVIPKTATPPASPPTALPRVAPGALPQSGEVINLASYFGIVGSTFLDAGGNFKPFNLTDPQQIAPIIAALDHESIVEVQSRPPGLVESILFTLDAHGKAANFGYHLLSETIAFSVDGHTYIIPAPANFRALWVRLVCSRPH